MSRANDECGSSVIHEKTLQELLSSDPPQAIEAIRYISAEMFELIAAFIKKRHSCLDASAIADVCQETAIELLRKYKDPDFEADRSNVGFILTVANRRGIDASRKQLRRRETSDLGNDMDVSSSVDDDVVVLSELEEKIVVLINDLPDLQKKVAEIKLKEYRGENISFKQIADLINNQRNPTKHVGEDNVKRAWYVARKKLRDDLHHFVDEVETNGQKRGQGSSTE